MRIIFVIFGGDVILYIEFIRLIRWFFFFYREETVHLIDLIWSIPD